MDGPTDVALKAMKVGSFREVAELETAVILERLDDAPFPPSEKMSAAVLLTEIEKLRKESGRLFWAARLTLAVAFLSLIVAVLAAVHVF